MKITLSKQQWELIGKKTGWIKTSGSQNIENMLSRRISLRCLKFLKSLPNYNAALDIVDNIQNKQVSPEQAGLNADVFNQAQNIFQKIKTAANNDMIKESFNIDARVIAAIILIVLGFFVGKMTMQDVGDTTKATQQTYEKQMENISK